MSHIVDILPELRRDLWEDFGGILDNACIELVEVFNADLQVSADRGEYREIIQDHHLDQLILG